MDLAHRLASEIQQEARRGDVPQLAEFIEGRLKEQFEFADVGLMLWDPSSGKEERLQARNEFKEGFTIMQGNQTIGTLGIEPHGSAISGETKMVLEEIGRLSTKLNQLLQFSRPAVRGGSAIGSCDARVAVEEVAGVLSHEAERRGVKM